MKSKNEFIENSLKKNSRYQENSLKNDPENGIFYTEDFLYRK